MSTILKKAMEAAGVGAGVQPFSPVRPNKEREAGGPKKREQRTVLYRVPIVMKDERGKPMKEVGGVRTTYTEAETREYQGTEYANGMLVCTYEGDVMEGNVRDGQGTYTYTKGETFEGQWKGGRRHGPGMLAMTTGHKHEGGWKEDKMQGEGREVFAKGEVYTGDYSKGRMHGQGVLDYGSTGSLFEGQWQDGRKHGKGRILYANGDVFEGTWANGRREGRGTTTYAKGGRVYASDWVEGRMSGEMRLVDTNARPPPPRKDQRDRRVKQDKRTLIPMELATFRPKSDQSELPTETMLRLQLAFEAYDREFVGVISTTQLGEVWQANKKADPQTLALLDRERTGCVDLYSLYTSWYPMVPRRDVERYLSTFVTPDEVLRHRGECCGVANTYGGKGFLHITNGETLSSETLGRVGHAIGGERFSDPQFKKVVAKTGRPEVTFSEVLDVWYPNVPLDMIVRYEVPYLPDGDFEAIQSAYNELAVEGMLIVEDFDAAQVAWQNWLADTATPSADGSLPQASTHFLDLPSTPQSPLYANMVHSTFLGEPVWPLGHISMTLKMLQTIDMLKGGYAFAHT